MYYVCFLDYMNLEILQKWRIVFVGKMVRSSNSYELFISSTAQMIEKFIVNN